MSKAKKKAEESVVQQPAAPADTEQPAQVVAGDGTGEALPEVVEESVVQEAEAVQQPDDPDANPDPEPDTAPKPEQEDLIDAFVLCDGSLDGITHYRAGTVLQGLPESLAEAHSNWLDTHPAAVEHAMNSGAETVAYFADQY